MKSYRFVISLIFLYFHLAYPFICLCTSTETLTNTNTKVKSKTETLAATLFSASSASQLSFRQKLSFFNPISLSNTIRNSNATSYHSVKQIREETGGLETQKQSFLDKHSGNYWEGWVKYFKIIKGEKPKSFFKNFYYQKQMKMQNIDLSEMKDGKFRFIKNQNLFYVIVTGNNINIANSRDEQYIANYDTIHVDLIAPVDESKHGGIEDFGSFSEGYCFKIRTTIEKLMSNIQPDTFTIDYVMCCGSKNEKLQLMGILRSLKKKKQQQQGLVLIPSDPSANKNTLQEYLYNTKTVDNTITNKNKNDTLITQNGRWIILQDWSQCSLKCGGGITVLHRYCIPPIGGGNECEGEAIIKRECNTVPCKSIIKRLKEEKVINKPPIIQVIPFTDRPQRYIKCKVKEADVMVVINEKEIGMLPMRVVLNNMTISLYRNSEYISNKITYDLFQTEFLKSNKNPKCFILQQGDIKNEVCPFNRFDESFLDEWFYDFSLFKNQCHVDRKADLIKDLNNDLKLKMASTNSEIDEKRKELVQEHVRQQMIDNMDNKLINTADLTYTALEREKSLEEMIKNEEKQKEDDRIKQLNLLIKLEEEKKNKINKRIKEKEIETDVLLQREEMQMQLKKTKEEAAKRLLESRNKLKLTLAQMKKKSESIEMNLRTKLFSVRQELAEQVASANKKGDSEKCSSIINDTSAIKEYCHANFSKDYIKYLKCEEPDDFCTTCCENEFGEMFMELRKKCVKEICFKNNNNNSNNI